MHSASSLTKGFQNPAGAERRAGYIPCPPDSEPAEGQNRETFGLIN